MKIQIWILGLLTALLFFNACKDDKDDAEDERYKSENPVRVKRITGENGYWGKYELEFHYRPDGLLERVWRFGDLPYLAVRDTLGYFKVQYDVNYHEFEVVDYVLPIDADSVKKLQGLYPGTVVDTIRKRLDSKTLFSSKLSKGIYTVKECRPPRSVYGDYVNVSSQTLMVEKNPDGNPLVIRCYDDVYGMGGDNGKYERVVNKYEFAYAGDEMVDCVVYRPDAHLETSWRKLWNMTFSYYSGILTGVDSDSYKMRRSGHVVVLAEPGKNTTYTLNDYGLAVKMENTDGENAKIEYEAGSGNFSELYSTPLDRVLGKVWTK